MQSPIERTSVATTLSQSCPAVSFLPLGSQFLLVSLFLVHLQSFISPVFFVRQPKATELGAITMSVLTSEDGSPDSGKAPTVETTAAAAPQVARNGVVLIPQPTDRPEDPLVRYS